MDKILKNATVVTSGYVKKMDIGIQSGRIAALAEGLDEPGEVIDCTGKLVLAGGVDVHAHLNEPGYTWREDYLHGTRAAAAGGTTCFVDMPLQNTPSLISVQIFRDKEKAVAGKAYVDYAFWGGLVEDNLDEMTGMKECGAKALKAFVSPSGPDYPSASIGLIYQAMQIAAKEDILLGFHCEDYSMITRYQEQAIRQGKNTWRDYLDARPVIAEEIAVQNILDMAEETGARVHICHVSHPKVAERIHRAKQKGIRVTAETCPHYLIYSEEDVIRGKGVFKCSPPLRKARDRDALWEYINNGTLSCIVSDHSPAAPEEKADQLSVWEIWGGISGLQTGMQVMYEYGVRQGKISLNTFAAIMSENAASIFRLPGKGRIEIGQDADLIVFDPEKSWKITPDSLYYLNKISAYCGLEGKGMTEKTIVRGNIVYDNGTFSETPVGKLLK